MTAEIHFLAAWRSKGDRRAPTQEQIRDARLCSARERLRQIQADAADYEAQVEKLDQRL